MRIPLTVPEIGVAEDQPVIVSAWFVSIGDEIIEGDRVVELLLDDMTFDVASPVSGTLVEIAAEVDEPVAGGALLGRIECDASS